MKAPLYLRIPAAVVSVAFWVFFLAVPLVTVFLSSAGDVAGTGAVMGTGMFAPATLAVVRTTVWQALLSTAFSLLAGFPLGLWAGTVLSGRAARISNALLAMPYGVPTVVVATAAVMIMGRSGLLARCGIVFEWLYTLKGLVLVHVFLNAPLVALVVARARAGVPSGAVEAARTLGAGRLPVLWHIVRPHLQWNVAGVAVQVFGLCSMSFALVLILGGGPPVETLETAVYLHVRGSWPDVGAAAGAAIWQGVVTMLPWAAVVFFQSRSGSAGAGAGGAGGLPSGHVPAGVGAWLCVFFCLLFVVPYLAYLVTAPWALWLDPSFAGGLARPVVLTLLLSILSATGALVVAAAGVFFSLTLPPPVRSVPAFLMSLPSGVSILVLGLGVWMAYGGLIDPFEGSLAAMAALQTVTLVPLVFKLLWPLAGGMRFHDMEAALTLGAIPARAFMLVEWPRWRPVVLSAFGLSLGAAAGEVAAVSLFYSERLVTLPLAMTRMMGRYDFEKAHAAGAALLVVALSLAAGASLAGDGNSSYAGKRRH